MKKLLFVIFLSFFVQASFGQLSNFVLTVTKTDESCTGNGSLSFNVTNTVAGSIIVYRIYKLPDVVNTIAVTSANTFGGLAAGTYRVIATQTLGNSSGTQQQDATILDVRSMVTYQIASTAVGCDSGTITVTTLSGNPLTYEIVNGPVTRPPQPSNIFAGLPAGTYNIRVNDICGEGVVQTHTLTFSNPPNLTISNPSTDCPLNSCNSITANFTINSNDSTDIRYPLTVQITVFPPGGGAPIVQNQTITSGNSVSQTVSSIIPLYYGQLYTYNIRVVDACGNVYIRNSNQLNQQLLIEGIKTYENCLKGIRLNLCNFLPPYNVTFLASPAGFNPATYNGLHPGPFTAGTTNYVSTPASSIPNGTYTIQVTDACNHTATTQVVISEVEPFYSIISEPTNCDVDNYIQIPRDRFAGPFIASAVITSSSANLGQPIPYDVTSLIAAPGVLLMPLPPGTYTIQGIDVCGRPYSYTFTLPPFQSVVTALPNNITGCSTNGLGSIRVAAVGSYLTTVVITQAPPAYTQPLPHNVPIPNATTASMLVPNLPAGTYSLTITDSCGNTFVRIVTISSNISVAPLSFYNQKGCGENYGAVALVSPNGRLQSVIITAAPSSFPFDLPYDVSFNIYANNGIFYMNSFPEGSYTFYTRDECNQERTPTYNIVGYHQTDNIQVIGQCGSFDLNMNYTENLLTGQIPAYWLQKFDSANNQWVHPITNVVYPPNSAPNSTNSHSLTNSVMNYNIAATGTFRILVRYNYYSNGTPNATYCIQTIKTFDYAAELKIISAYAIPCVNGGSQVFIIANGAPPLDYRITSMNGNPFTVNNGTSNSFASLQPGTYNFRVQDVCGNIVNRLFDINTLQEPQITPSNLCAGSNGQLSVQPFSFLHYEWWKGNDTTNILSTTNTLDFNPYTAANAGTYHVRIYSTTLNSCVDRVLDYTIAPNTLPNAGLDGTRVVCATTTSINLFTILGGNYDSGGTWEEITSSGMLVGNNWVSAGLATGTYIFRYTVNGFCSATDDATVTITLAPPAEVPVITVDPTYCPGEDVAFSVQSIPGANYQWSGPNDFSSALQNPTITDVTAANAGNYTVTAFVGDCQTPASIAINVLSSPEYTYLAACRSGVFTVEIIPTEGSSFDPNTATYAWTGPNNFSSTSNPLILTNQPRGDYNVVVTNNEGCFVPQTIGIASTFCDFPNVITPNNDGNNDNFDLTNYDVQLLQVFSRWGRLVYEESNYIDGWYGQNMCGGFLPDSTYYYFVKLRNGEEKHGWIFVGRG